LWQSYYDEPEKRAAAKGESVRARKNFSRRYCDRMRPQLQMREPRLEMREPQLAPALAAPAEETGDIV
jgi:hypothetical protein